MIALGHFLITLARMIEVICPTFYLLMLVRIILSWTSPDPRSPIVQFIYGCTEPLLAPIRQRIPPLGAFDLSPIVFGLILFFIQSFFGGALFAYGQQILISAHSN